MPDEIELCMACNEPLKEGDQYLPDVSGSYLHYRCCGPERENYVSDVGEGTPLRPDEPIPAPKIWSYKD